MNKKVIMLLMVLCITYLSSFADDIPYLTQKIENVAAKLELNLVIIGDKRDWSKQIELMSDKNFETLKRWYGEDTATAYIKYKNGEIDVDTLMSKIKNNSLMQHPAGKAVDIGISSSGLTDEQVNAVIAALKEEGLYVFDERQDGINCLYVSCRKYKQIIFITKIYRDKYSSVLDYPVTIQVKMVSFSSISSNKLDKVE